MKTFASNRLRNIGIFSHGGAGKTSLTEAILYNAGHITRLGKVDDGNTVTDYLPEEIKRKVTVNATLAPVEWKDCKINLMDTPGYSDFIGEVRATLRVVDSSILVICGVSGVEVQTEVMWDYTDNLQLPRFFFINKLDRENANFFRVLDDLKTKFGSGVVALQIPIGSEDSFSGLVDLLTNKAYKFEGTKVTEIPIPAELENHVEEYRNTIYEAAAESDDVFLMKYLEGELLSEEEVSHGLREGIKSGKIVPVFCGSSLKNIGIQLLMDSIVNYLPSPNEAIKEEVSDDANCAIVFKTLADPYVGRLSFIKVIKGKLNGDTVLYNSNKEKDEKIGSLFVMRGKNQEVVPFVEMGDIVAIAKLTDTTTGNTLCTKDKPVILEGIEFPLPTYSVAIQPKSRGDEDKVGSALVRLIEEDPTIKLQKNVETKESILTGMGDQHIDIIVERLQRKFGVEVLTKSPKVPYRETIKGNCDVEYKHKKQSGGHGQYGHVKIKMEPLFENDYEFTESIFGGSVPKQYHPAVEKGVREAMQEGVLAGYPVTNIRVNLYDGSYHDVDSSEMAFKIAASQAFKKGMEKAKPVLLEPIMNVEIKVPDQYMGDIISDLNGKRGRIMGMEPDGRLQVVKAQVPLSEMFRYAIDLKSITQGRGTFKMEFACYEDVPTKIAEDIIAELSKEEKTS